MYKIYIDQGHGGKDPGAVGINNVHEADINLSVGKYLDAELKRHGIETMMSRTTDTTKTLETRAAEANAWGADIVCSIHCNAFDKESANGTEVIVYKKGGNAEKVALKVLSQLILTLKTTNRGVKENNSLYILRKTNAPAILCEIGFVTNKTDKEKIDEAHEQKSVAIAICKGICEYFGITYTKEETNMSKFTDIKGHYAEEYINEAANMGIANGVGNNRFEPDGYLTRGQACILIVKVVRYVIQYVIDLLKKG